MIDVYFNLQYAKLYEKIDSGTAEEFAYSNDFGEVKHIFIKRPIDILLDDNTYYDLVSPYGYAGPYISNLFEEDDRSFLYDNLRLINSKYEKKALQLVDEFFNAYYQFCIKNNIVAEFIRFNPLINNAKFGMKKFNPEFNRKTIAIDISNNEYKMIDFTSRCRNTIKRAYKLGVEIEVDENCTRIEDFIKIYNLTMQKDNADKYYYFSRNYYINLKKTLKNRMILINALYQGKIISSSIFMMSDTSMHYHLSGTHPDYYSYSANNAILDKACEYGNSKGLKWLHLGGGTSSEEHNTLFAFKKQFGRNEYNKKDFYIGKCIYNKKIYDRLVELVLRNENTRSGYFPLYRA